MRGSPYTGGLLLNINFFTEYFFASLHKLIVASKLIDFELLEKSVKEISLDDLNDIYGKMLKGETSGRYIVNLNK